MNNKKNDLKDIYISGIFNSDDLATSKEYCVENNCIFVGYDGKKQEMHIRGTEQELNKIEQLFEGHDCLIRKTY